MSKRFKPMLAANAPTKIVFPMVAFPKIDGIRCVVMGGKPVSRSLKNIRNNFVREYLENIFEQFPEFIIDGELTVGPPNNKNVMQETSSGVMSENGTPDFNFWVFDCIENGNNEKPFSERYSQCEDICTNINGVVERSRAIHLKGRIVSNQEELDEYENSMIEFGFEGVILRHCDAPYKYGRSTTKEGSMLKIKRFSDGEAIITGFEELLVNNNEATTNELGHTERTSHAENKTPGGTLGALIVEDCKTGIEFNIGTGMTDGLRESIWCNKAQWRGVIVKYKHFEAGSKIKPRHPVYMGVRDVNDM